MELTGLTFLKLGGSLITDKDRPQTPRPDVLARLAEEIVSAFRASPGMRLILGHGSGSFGHIAARKYGTRHGVHSQEEWSGFAEVWRDARALNQIVVEALSQAGLTVIAFPPSACVIASDGQVKQWDTAPIQSALEHGLIPLVNGDTIFDAQRGGTILSTEDLFIHLARALYQHEPHAQRPIRMLLAGRETGVWADFPACTRLIETITPQNMASIAHQISGSASVDVTGGMLEKVRIMLNLAETLPGFEALIFSGLEAGNTFDALSGKTVGTMIRNK